MEINIPDLDDVKFVERCRCTKPYGPVKGFSDCAWCEGAGVRLTRIGEELFKFLHAVGCRPTDGWKQIEP